MERRGGRLRGSVEEGFHGRKAQGLWADRGLEGDGRETAAVRFQGIFGGRGLRRNWALWGPVDGGRAPSSEGTFVVKWGTGSRGGRAGWVFP